MSWPTWTRAASSRRLEALRAEQRDLGQAPYRAVYSVARLIARASKISVDLMRLDATMRVHQVPGPPVPEASVQRSRTSFDLHGRRGTRLSVRQRRPPPRFFGPEHGEFQMGSINLVHGFRVLAHGKVTPGFVKALKRLEAKGYADEGCVVVKTTPWSQSAITHEGGRYLHPENPYARQVIEAMRHRGIEPPPLPFILAPGPMILYHEWGHHVDRIWSREDHDVLFSFRWFSHFYEISYRRPPGFEQFNLPMPISGPIETEDQAMGVMQQWPKLASELLAHLFEAWMRSREKPPWDLCEPQCLDHRFSESAFCIRLDLRGDVTAAEVQSNTFALFSRGIRDTPDQPSVREGLLGPRTFALLEALRRAMRTLRAGPFKPQQ